MMRILCVCLGNICRSPMMQGALERAVAQAGLTARIDSAGLGDWHRGDPPDPRAVKAATAQGIQISNQRARKLAAADFQDFDLILTAEAAQADELRRRAPDGATARIAPWLSFAGGGDVPDPYCGDDAEFDRALTLIGAAIPALTAHIRAR